HDVVDLDRPADDGGITAVAVLPDTVAENDDRRCSRPIVFWQEVAPQLRLLANQLERGGRDEWTLKPLGRPSFVADVHDAAAERRKAGKRASGPAVVLEIEIRHPAIAQTRIAGADDHDAIRIVDRKTANQDGVDEREDRRVDADAQGERDDSH